MTAADKDTIYIDIDDEITGIIDKMKGSNDKVVALVLPKRAAVFQSIVNMKLLKRASDASNKHLVLITSEAGLLPLAGAAGVHVAKTLTSKPEIPTGPDMEPDVEEAVNEDPDEIDTEPDPTKTLGQLAGSAAAADGVETLVMDDEDLPPEADGAKPVPKSFDPPGKKGKKMKIPDFDRFRLLLVGGGLLLILLIVGFIFAASVLPKATITIKTDATIVDVNQALNLSTTAKELNIEDNTIPAKLAQTQKTYIQQVPTTGQKNNGNKASGKVKFINCSAGDPITVPAGTGVTGSNNATYVTQEDASMPVGSKSCKDIEGATSTVVAIVAINPGTASNLSSGASLSVASNGSFSSSSVKATVSESIAGGTDSIVQVVNQNDINSAKAKIVANDNELKQILTDALKKDNYYAISATYAAAPPAITTSNNVGEAANNVTVTETVTYTMFGVHKSDLQALIENNIKSQIDSSKQSILDNGLNKATYNVDSLSPTGGQLTVSVRATAGPDLDIKTIKREAAGQKPGAVKDKLRTHPDVTSVDVKLSPFWVSSVPTKTSKIKVVIAKPVTDAKSSTSNVNTN